LRVFGRPIDHPENQISRKPFSRSLSKPIGRQVHRHLMDSRHRRDFPANALPLSDEDRNDQIAALQSHARQTPAQPRPKPKPSGAVERLGFIRHGHHIN
jgi:hypothetical protein